MICGVVAGVLVFLYARLFGEAPMTGAIGLEDQLAHAAGAAHEHEDEIVSRDVQSTWGLFTGTVFYAVAVGGLFALLYAFAWGRVGRLGARGTAAMLAVASFAAVYVVPFLKYPPNPPAVGNPDTIQFRTALYFGMIAISIAAMVAAVNLGRALLKRMELWHAAVLAGVVYIGLVGIAYAVLPGIDEVSAEFPATLLWQFRIASFGMQLLLWTVLGLLFGELTERAQRAGNASLSMAQRRN
jgi:predicted cobalt transporter CbtA